jgi:hypothetical protein
MRGLAPELLDGARTVMPIFTRVSVRGAVQSSEQASGSRARSSSTSEFECERSLVRYTGTLAPLAYPLDACADGAESNRIPRRCATTTA